MRKMLLVLVLSTFVFTLSAETVAAASKKGFDNKVDLLEYMHSEYFYITYTEGVEIGSVIYKHNREYFYTPIIIGTENSIPGLPQAAAEINIGEIVGYMHTHPVEMCQFFSSADVRFANRTGTNLYLITSQHIRVLRPDIHKPKGTNFERWVGELVSRPDCWKK